MKHPFFKSFIPLKLFLVSTSVLLAGCIGAAKALETATTPISIVDANQITPGPTIAPVSVATAVPTAAPTALPTLTPTAIPSLTPAPAVERTTYQLDATFNYGNRQLFVNQTVDFLNDTDLPIQELILVVEANHNPGVFFLENISVGFNAPLADFTFQDRYLTVTLQDTLAPGERVSFELAYFLVLPAEASELGFWRQVNIGDWYPFVAAQTHNGEWILDTPGLVGEHQTYPLANFEVTFALEDAPADLVIAACAQPTSVQDNVYTYTHHNARNFALSLSTEYLTVSQTIDDIVVTSYFYAGYELAGYAALDATVNALQLFQENFGAYPHQSLDIVIADFGDGLEFDGMYFLGESYYRTYGGNALGFLTMIAVHETAHMWWYGKVGNNQARDPWLDEAFAIYTEYLYYERFEPDWTDWWWKFRVDRHAPEGTVDAQVGEFIHRRPYINAVYLRGVQFMHEIRLQIGDDQVFTEFLRDYIAIHEGQIVEPEDFWRHLGKYLDDATIADLQSQYFK